MCGPGRFDPARAAGLLAAVALHGVLLAAPWQARVPPPPQQRTEALQPLQVMLLSEQVGRGTFLMAPPALVAAAGTQPVPQPPPPLPVPEVVVAEPMPPDRPALPVSAPDLAPLLAQRPPAGPVRLRLHIAADGRVDEVEVVEAAPDDEAFARRLAELLRNTPHIPARRGGLDVASTKEVRLSFGSRPA
jgi:hypothetical protein